MNNSINFLVVEDNPSKVSSIQYLLDGLEVEFTVDYVMTPSETIQKLKKNNYDFFILDMSLPAYSEESHSIGSLSGKQILQTMKHKKISVPTVILTQWDVFGHHENTISLNGLKKELLDKFDKFLLGVVFWDSSSELWKEQILEYIAVSVND
ncbi:response regulator [Vibrio cholerae]|uniref:response regulator n=1 Tax=Vibrio cholerae TaxID=666 RepID=UPI0018F0DD48|nr:response regulator [Vibrio cholerae]MBJ6879868.1 response regulator [Vibrio cholerae]MBJ6883585.1 response regulator [Vibrio cholerae]MBJ6891087.1 response regulator [Vibrio cholerae]